MIGHWLYALTGNAAMALNLASFWMVDVRKLRMIAIASSVCFILYSLIVPGGPLWIMALWSVVFLSVNLYRLIREAPDGSSDAGCVCYGNWRALVGEVDALIGKSFMDGKGVTHTFFGLVHGEDDYYYGMIERGTGRVRLLSCVGDIEGHGFVQVKAPADTPDTEPDRHAAWV